MQELLNKLELRILALVETLSIEFMIPETDIIDSFLAFQAEQREAEQQVRDLKQLKAHIQDELDQQEAMREQEQAVSDEEAWQQQIIAERKKLTRELRKLNPRSAKASQLLLELSNLGRG